MKRLNKEGRYRAPYANLQAARGDVAMGIGNVMQSIARQAPVHPGHNDLLPWVAHHRQSDPGSLLSDLLTHSRAGSRTWTSSPTSCANRGCGR